MYCKDFDLYGSAYVDHMLPDKEKLDFESHIRECECCKIKLQNLVTIIESINEIEEVELPIDFSSELRIKLEKERNYNNKNIFTNKKKLLSGIVAGMLIFITSLSLINNSFIKRDRVQMFTKVEDKNANEENIDFEIASEESQKQLADVRDEVDEELKIESATQPRMMTIDNATESQNEKKLGTDENKKETMEETNGKNSYLMPILITSILGMVVLIYKLLKK